MCCYLRSLRGLRQGLAASLRLVVLLHALALSLPLRRTPPLALLARKRSSLTQVLGSHSGQALSMGLSFLRDKTCVRGVKHVQLSSTRTDSSSGLIYPAGNRPFAAKTGSGKPGCWRATARTCRYESGNSSVSASTLAEQRSGNSSAHFRQRVLVACERRQQKRLEPAFRSARNNAAAAACRQPCLRAERALPRRPGGFWLSFVVVAVLLVRNVLYSGCRSGVTHGGRRSGAKLAPSRPRTRGTGASGSLSESSAAEGWSAGEHTCSACFTASTRLGRRRRCPR